MVKLWFIAALFQNKYKNDSFTTTKVQFKKTNNK